MNPLSPLTTGGARSIALAALAMSGLALLTLSGCATPSHTPRYAGECVTQVDGLKPYAGKDCHTCANVTVGVAGQAPRCGVAADANARQQFDTATGPAMANRPVLQVVTAESFVPFEMRDKDTGKMVGFDISMLKEIAKRAGFDYQLAATPFVRIIPLLTTGKKDIAMASMKITDQRAKKVDFSEPYFLSGLRILRHKGDQSINKLEDLQGKQIGAQLGATSYKYLVEKFGNDAHINAYPTVAGMYADLMDGKIDAVFYDQPSIAYFARTQGKGRVETTGRLYRKSHYGVAFPRGSKWVEPVNKAITAIKQDGTYVTIYRKWFDATPPGMR